MAEEKKTPLDSATSKADVQALLEEAEAEAAEAEALAAAARARARAARLRREALAQTEAKTEAEPEPAAEAETAHEAPAAEKDGTDTAEPEADDDVTETVEATDTDATEAADETAEEEEPEAKSARARRRLRLPSWSVAWKAAVIVLICVFLGASGYMVWSRNETTERNQRAANFVAGARQGVVNLTSMDFNRAKEDVQRVIDSSTGPFRDDFQARAKDFTTVVEQSKVVTQGTVNAAAVQSINGDYALVLVAATSHVTNAAGAKDAPRSFRLKVTVKNDGGQYKMSNVEFIP